MFVSLCSSIQWEHNKRKEKHLNIVVSQALIRAKQLSKMIHIFDCLNFACRSQNSAITAMSSSELTYIDRLVWNTWNMQVICIKRIICRSAATNYTLTFNIMKIMKCLCFAVFSLENFDGTIPFDFRQWIDLRHCCNFSKEEKGKQTNKSILS